MSDDTVDMVSKALRRAWSLGQVYWQQADSQYTSQHRKSDETQGKFEALIEETRAALSQPAPQGVAEVMDLVEQYASDAADFVLAGSEVLSRAPVEQAITAIMQERDAHRAALDPAVAEIVKLKARIAELEVNYHELLYAVASKHPDETRHQTALRYIMRAEKAHGSDGAGAASSKEAP